ncbi:hypothetical protein HNO88_002796 [Novosphingobium chloroacetimidivorans]|uniref:Gene transfer agent family protein n=1 Tax=Novosphingobium chloroacetimidivorans TaxID=1428314 RepID=A0A7W7KAY3_9SPHN|nr:gene transfer agent family protein [Novosphingobium chloroacetimidivorans]MBB4859467.1 hypothetical protein [Novosphingobium chloroacetimidivorans]
MSNPIKTRSAILENVFVGEGYFDLCLKIGELITLQERTGVGPFVLANRLIMGEWRVEDVIETIRLGLIGGGMDNRNAYDLVTRTIVEGNIFDYAAIAGSVVMTAIMGVDDEQPDADEESDANFPIAPMD